MAIDKIQKTSLLIPPAGLDTHIQYNNNGQLAGSSSFVINSSGHIGIGTNDPKDRLHVKIGSDLNWQFGYPSSSTTSLAALNDAESSYVTGRIDAGPLQLNSQSGGSVSIGSSSPTNQKLLISENGGGNYPILEVMNTNTTANAKPMIRVGTGGDAVLELYRIGNAATAYINAAQVGNGNLAFQTESNTKMVIANNGNVGIGTVTPRCNLNLDGNNSTAVTFGIDNTSGGGTLDISCLGSAYTAHGAAPGEVWFYSPDNINIGGATGNTNDIKFLGGGSERVRITSDGNVGIGTDVPDTSLHISGSGSIVGKVVSTNASAVWQADSISTEASILYFTTAGSQAWKFQKAAVTGNLEIRNSTDLTKFTMLDDGDVGIGINVPYSKLTIQGSNYVKTDQGRATDGLALGGGGAGEGVHTNGLSFGFGGGSAAISGTQLTNDSDSIGLSFFTHPSGTGANDSIEMMRLNGIGLAIGALPEHLTASTALHIENTSTEHITIIRAFDVTNSVSEQIGVIRGGANNTAGDPEIGGSIGFGVYDVDGGGAGTDFGGSIRFNTRTEGASVPNEKMRINSSGAIERLPTGGTGYSYEFVHSETTNTDLSVDITVDTDANYWHSYAIEATVSYVNNQTPRGVATFLIFCDGYNGNVVHSGDVVQASTGTIPTLSVSVSSGGPGLQETITLTFNTWDGVAVAHKAIGHFRVLTTYSSGSRITHS